MKVIGILIILLFLSLSSVNADSNGIWIDASDIRSGTFSSDESAGNFVFPNNLDVSNRLTTSRIVSTTANITSFLETNSFQANVVNVTSSIISNKVEITGNAGSLDIVGNNHAYIEFFPQGVSSRKAWVGFGSSGSEVLTLQSEADDLVLNPGSNNVGVGLTNPSQKLDVNGNLRVRSNLYANGNVYSTGPIYESGSRVATKTYVDSAVGSAPIKFDVYDTDTTSYKCVTRNLQSHCGDEEGCTIRLLLQHETEPDDRVRVIEQTIFMEQPDMGSTSNGVYGWTRQQGGGDYAWRTGTSSKYSIYAPWGWSWAYNYRHSYCSSGGSAAHSDPYDFTFMSHPRVKTTVVVFD